MRQIARELFLVAMVKPVSNGEKHRSAVSLMKEFLRLSQRLKAIEKMALTLQPFS